MKRIFIKSGVEQLPLFEQERYHFYEAFIKNTAELPALLQTPLKLMVVHLPSVIKVGTESYPLDFCRDGAAGDAAYDTLRDVIQFCDAHHVKYVVIHLGFFNSLQQDRQKVLERTARRFAQLPAMKTTLCFENVPHWITLSLQNEPVISLPEHFAYFQRFFPAANAVLDTDHLAITTVFNCFYRQFVDENPSGEKNNTIRQRWENNIAAETSANIAFYQEKISQALKKYLSVIQPALIHAVGSDFCNYRLVERLPVVGEALPLGYRGKIQGFYVKDRIDHTAWLSALPAEVDITLELHVRPEYDYLQEIGKNCRFLCEKLGFQEVVF